MPLGSEGIPGDLHVILQVAPHEIFKRQGSNIFVDASIPFHTAILGGYIRVPTIDGNVELKVPPGSQPEQQARMRKRGIQANGHRGDQIVTFKVTIPE
jgi:molecular chaperone DnaJ